MLAHKAVVNYKHQSLDLWSAVCVDLPFLSFPHPSIFLLVTDSKWSALSLDSSGLGPLHSLFLSSTDSLSLTPLCVSVFMSVCLSVCMSECLFVCLSLCPYVCLCFCLSVQHHAATRSGNDRNAPLDRQNYHVHHMH